MDETGSSVRSHTMWSGIDDYASIVYAKKLGD